MSQLMRLNKNHRSELQHRFSRRTFLGGMVVGATFTVVPRAVLGGKNHIPPGNKTTLGLIGMGGQGHVDLFNFLQLDRVQVTSVCDVNREGGA